MDGTEKPLIILVDDEPEVRLLWETSSEILGINCLVINQFEAMDLSENVWKEARLLITDWLMPDYSGDMVIAKARASHPTIDVHILTAADDLIQGKLLPPKTRVWVKPTGLDLILKEAGYG